MKFRNFKMVDYVVYGRGSFNQLDEIIAPHRQDGKPMIFLVDHFFEGKPLAKRVPSKGNDKIIFADVTHEPKTTYVDKLAKQLKDEFGSDKRYCRDWWWQYNGSGQGRFINDE